MSVKMQPWFTVGILDLIRAQRLRWRLKFVRLKLSSGDLEGAEIDLKESIISSEESTGRFADTAALHWFDIGNAWVKRNEQDRAIVAFRRSLDLDRSNANVWKQLGFLCLEKEGVPDARVSCGNFHSLARSTEASDEDIKTLSDFGELELDRKEIERDADFISDALSFTEDAGGQEMLARDFASIGELFKKKGGYHAATEHYLRALQINKEGGDDKHMFSNLRALGNVAKFAKKFDQAATYFRQALDLVERLNDKTLVGIAVEELSDLARSRNDLDTADLQLKRAVSMYSQISSQPDIARCMCLLAEISLESDRFMEAKSYLNDALQIYMSMVSGWGMACVLDRLGRVAQKQRDFGGAVEKYRASLTFWVAKCDPLEIARIKCRLASAAIELGDFKQAEEQLIQARALYHVQGDDDDIANCLTQMGRLYSTWGRPADAVVIWREAIELYRDLEDIESCNKLGRQILELDLSPDWSYPTQIS